MLWNVGEWHNVKSDLYFYPQTNTVSIKINLPFLWCEFRTDFGTKFSYVFWWILAYLSGAWMFDIDFTMYTNEERYCGKSKPVDVINWAHTWWKQEQKHVVVCQIVKYKFKVPLWWFDLHLHRGSILYRGITRSVNWSKYLQIYGMHLWIKSIFPLFL